MHDDEQGLIVKESCFALASGQLVAVKGTLASRSWASPRYDA